MAAPAKPQVLERIDALRQARKEQDPERVKEVSQRIRRLEAVGTLPGVRYFFTGTPELKKQIGSEASYWDNLKQELAKSLHHAIDLQEAREERRYPKDEREALIRVDLSGSTSAFKKLAGLAHEVEKIRPGDWNSFFEFSKKLQNEASLTYRDLFTNSNRHDINVENGLMFVEPEKGRFYTIRDYRKIAEFLQGKTKTPEHEFAPAYNLTAIGFGSKPEEIPSHFGFRDEVGAGPATIRAFFKDPTKTHKHILAGHNFIQETPDYKRQYVLKGSETHIIDARQSPEKNPVFLWGVYFKGPSGYQETHRHKLAPEPGSAALSSALAVLLRHALRRAVGQA